MPDAPANPLAAEAARALGDRLVSANERLGELTLTVRADAWAGACATLRDEPSLAFSMLIDLCGLDYRGHAGWPLEAPRFAVVVHLLSTAHNQRVRVRTLCDDDDFPGVGTLTEVWPAASWFEREAFDLFGIVFDGHPDLRRILTDYGFVGHPFRKDFPVSGHVEMRYDPEQKRVIYQPVTIEPREIVPRVVREASYGTGKGGGG